MNWKDERNSCNTSLQRAAPLLRSVLKKKKEKKSSLFKKYAFSVDLVSVLPALETQEWLLLIWPKWSHYPGVKESESWLTVMFPPCALLHCTLHWLSDALKWAGLFLALWWDFYQNFKPLDCILGRICTCAMALCLDLLCLGKWIEKNQLNHSSAC